MSLYERPWEPAVALGRRAIGKGLRIVRRREVIERNADVQHGDDCERIQLHRALNDTPSPQPSVTLSSTHAHLDDCADQPKDRGQTIDALLALDLVIR